MTLEELIAIPKGMKFEVYEELLKEKEKLKRQLRRISNEIYDEADSLEVLSDEIGSERYNKHLKAKEKAEIKRDKILNKLEQIELKLR